jgi:hypothetical protein
VKALVNASHDPIYNASDPATQLYLIDADKLLANVENKRISETAAREKMLRMLLAVQDRHHPESWPAIRRNDGPPSPEYAVTVDSAWT